MGGADEICVVLVALAGRGWETTCCRVSLEAIRPSVLHCVLSSAEPQYSVYSPLLHEYSWAGRFVMETPAQFMERLGASLYTIWCYRRFVTEINAGDVMRDAVFISRLHRHAEMNRKQIV